MASSSSLTAQIHICGFCKVEKIPEWTCSDCDQPICYECKRYHLWDLKKRSHSIVRAISLDSSPKTKTNLKDIRCADHVDRIYTNYCLECKTLVCPECLSVSSCHLAHRNKTIDKIHEESLEELVILENHIKQNMLPCVKGKLDSLGAWKDLHEMEFQEETKKIKEHANELRQLVTKFEGILIKELRENFVGNSNAISREQDKLEQLQKKLNIKIELIKQSKVKDNILHIQKDILDVSPYPEDYDKPLLIPKETNRFSKGHKISKEYDFGHLHTVPLNGEPDTEIKASKSYDFEKNLFVNHSSLAICKDGTILASDENCCYELKPDKSPRLIGGMKKVIDMLFLESKKLVFAVEKNRAIQVKPENDEIQTFYTLPDSKNFVLALCVSREGHIMILYLESTPTFMMNSECSKMHIKCLSQDGVLVKTIKCEEKVLLKKESLMSGFLYKFKITENINGNICIPSFFQDEVNVFSQDGKLIRKEQIGKPMDVESTSLGSIIVLSLTGQVVILNSNGKFVKNFALKDTLHCSPMNFYSFCLKNQDFVFVSEGKMHIVQFYNEH